MAGGFRNCKNYINLALGTLVAVITVDLSVLVSVFHLKFRIVQTIGTIGPNLSEKVWKTYSPDPEIFQRPMLNTLHLGWFQV